MSAGGPSPLARWHEIVAAQDAAGLDALLADDAEFSSPAVHTPQKGKALVAKYLRAALAILNDPTFRYTGEWSAERSAVLEFELTLDGTYVNGVDIIDWDERGRIVRFKVMIRPLKGLNAVLPLMAQQLQAASV